MIKPAARIAAIVLAAGGSARMGQPKQLLPIDGQPMVRRVAEQVLGASLAQVVVVVGANSELVSGALSGLPLDIVANANWSQGLSASLRVGLEALEPDIQAAIMVLADQPALTSELFAALVDGYLASGAPIRALFPELLAVEGDRGGRAVIARHPERVEELEVGLDAVISDVDTPEEYGAVVRLSASERDCQASRNLRGTDLERAEVEEDDGQ
jgi:molybdenum cofactor cytidylyltransferase